jgi:hypothetical protein
MTQATPPPSAPSPAAPVPPGAIGPAPSAAPVRRPGLDPATRSQTFIVAAVIAALFYGSSVLNEALPANANDQGQVTVAGEPIAVGGGVRITPVDGWLSSPHENGSGIRLEKGVVVIDLYPESVGGNAGALAKAYLEDILKPDATQLTATDTEVASSAEGTAARFGYQGIFVGVDVPIEGEVTAIFIGAQGVVADAWSRQGDLADLLGEVHEMLDTIEVGA